MKTNMEVAVLSPRVLCVGGARRMTEHEKAHYNTVCAARAQSAAARDARLRPAVVSMRDVHHIEKVEHGNVALADSAIVSI